jgi:hypothetical protein
LGWKAATIKIFKPADLTGLKPAGIPEQFFHLELNLDIIRIILWRYNFQIEYTNLRRLMSPSQ